MALKQLSLENLRELDLGKVAEAFQMLLQRAAKDCEDRPGDRRARKVILEANLTPVLTQEGHCDEVHPVFKIRAKLPDYQSKAYSCALRAGGMLVFDDDSPTNINQRSLPFSSSDPDQESSS